MNKYCLKDPLKFSLTYFSESYPEMLGTYIQDFDMSSDHPAYVKDSYYMYYLRDVLHHFEGWTISESTTDIGAITNEGDATCIEKADEGWEYLDEANNEWKTDVTLSFDCVDIAHCCDQVTLSSSGPGQDSFPGLMGTYQNTGLYEQGKPVFKQENSDNQLRLELKFYRVSHNLRC